LKTLSPNAAQTVAHRSTLFGEFVEIEFPFAFLEPEEALELAQRLVFAAHLAQRARQEPTTPLLPLAESLVLSDGASIEPRQTGKPAGDIFSDIKGVAEAAIAEHATNLRRIGFFAEANALEARG
jgi:hypothetical protein